MRERELILSDGLDAAVIWARRSATSWIAAAFAVGAAGAVLGAAVHNAGLLGPSLLALRGLLFGGLLVLVAAGPASWWLTHLALRDIGRSAGRDWLVDGLRSGGAAVILGLLGLAALVALLLLAPLADSPSFERLVSFVGLLGLGIGSLALVVGWLRAALRLCFVDCAIFEGESASGAIATSWRLARGAELRVAGWRLTAGLLGIAIPGTVLAAAAGLHPMASGFLVGFSLTAGGAVVARLVALLYVDRRARAA